MRSVRTITYALVVLAVMHLLVLTVKIPAVTFLLAHTGGGGFLPLSLATAAGITRDRTVLLGTVALVLLVAIPTPIDDLASMLLPIGLGIVLGTLIGNGIRDVKESADGQPVHRDDEPRS